MPHVEVQRSMSMADEFIDSSKVQKKDTWSPTYLMTVTAMTKLFHKFKNNIGPGAKLINQARFPKPVHVKVQKTYIPRRSDVRPLDMKEEDALGNIKAEWIDRSVQSDLSKPAERVILYAHGGAYFMGSRKTHRAVTWRLSKYANARILSIDYRLAPEHNFPLPINDMVSAYLYLIDPPAGSDSPKYRPDQIVFMGDSAGGNLCMTSMLYIRDSGKWEMPAGLGLLCPWLDLTHSSPSFVFNGAHDYLPAASSDPKHIKGNQVHYYVPEGIDMKEPLISPLFAEEDKEKPFPPMLLQVGTAERLLDESVRLYAERFSDSKVQVELAEQVSRAAIRRLADFCVKVTTPATAAAFERKIVQVKNRKGFPEEPFEDPVAYLEKQRERLRVFLGGVIVGESAETLIAEDREDAVEAVTMTVTAEPPAEESSLPVEEAIQKPNIVDEAEIAPVSVEGPAAVEAARKEAPAVDSTKDEVEIPKVILTAETSNFVGNHEAKKDSLVAAEEKKVENEDLAPVAVNASP
ncbi:hypothetical protein HDU67_009106 [Dinochytrium kinnereticum]|nr:hypothetical protein HDU67_009106 [Dinochytrium kinnereticum]